MSTTGSTTGGTSWKKYGKGAIIVLLLIAAGAYLLWPKNTRAVPSTATSGGTATTATPQNPGGMTLPQLPAGGVNGPVNQQQVQVIVGGDALSNGGNSSAHQSTNQRGWAQVQGNR